MHGTKPLPVRNNNATTKEGIQISPWPVGDLSRERGEVNAAGFSTDFERKPNPPLSQEFTLLRLRD